MQKFNRDLAELSLTEKAFSATKLVAALNFLDRNGLDTNHVFRGVSVTRKQLEEPNAKISILQQIRAFRNISDAASDPALPFEIGRSIHVSAYGLFGYAILCSKDYATAAYFAQKYHSLAAPLIEMEFIHDADRTGWRIRPIHHSLVDNDCYAFLLNLHIGIYLTLHQDLFGPDFCPEYIEVTTGSDARFRLPKDAAFGTVVGGSNENLLPVPYSLVEAPLMLSNDNTYRHMEEICQNELSGLVDRSGLSGQIRAHFLQAPGPILSLGNLDDVADHFRMTARTLRRHLRAEGSSLSHILDSVLSEVAIRYLREDQLTNEDIANVLGFSGPASFGRAFRRWTGLPPTEYRGRE